MFGISGSELMIVLLVALLLFGSKRLPELARNVARGIHEFKRGVNSTVAEIEEAFQIDKRPGRRHPTAGGPGRDPAAPSDKVQTE